mgnify:CR=1 FL=1|jgi:hypothetical protein
MKKSKYNFWDILAWICVIGIFIWLILKVLGIINTPVLLEFAPYFGATYLAGWFIHELKDNSKRLINFERFQKETIKEMHNLKLNYTKNHK